MNNRGDIPTLLVFVIALCLIGISLFGFVSFSNSMGREIGDFSKMIGEARFYEQYVIRSAEVIGKDAVLQSSIDSGYGIYRARGNFVKIANEFKPDNKGVKIDGVGEFFDKVERGEFEFSGSGVGQYVFEMNGLIIKVEKGINSFSHSVDIRIVFDKNGEIIEKEV